MVSSPEVPGHDGGGANNQGQAPVASSGPESNAGGVRGSQLQLPAELIVVLAALDEHKACLGAQTVHREILSAVPDREALSAEYRRGAWAELVAFAFSTRSVTGGGPWGTHFTPEWAFTQPDGNVRTSPDIAEIDVDVLAYWSARARAAKHPAIAARFADLVWDLTPVVTKATRGSGAIEFARIAIDGYIAASRMDDGNACSEAHVNLGRALQLALSVKDAPRIAAAVKAHLEYLDRTSAAERIGTLCYLFDSLFAARKGPKLEPDQEHAIVALLEARLATLASPGSGCDLDPHSLEAVSGRLAAYYERRGRLGDRLRVLRAVAEAFERRAGLGDALMRQHFLNEAHERYVRAGFREDAERVLLELEKVGPDAERRLVRTSVSHEIPTEKLEEYLEGMVAGDRQDALRRFVSCFVPDQHELSQRAESRAKEFPLSTILGTRPVKLGHGRIEADVGDTTGDPDGVFVHRTAEALQFQVPWVSWVLERFVQRGLTADQLLVLVSGCPLFEPDRMELIRRGVQAHLAGDYVHAIHLLIPQIEHAAVRLVHLCGMPATKRHQTGRGVLQAKNMNDVLAKDAWPVEGPGGENLRLYLLAALAHPKGLNIRNEVSHGLWPTDRFDRHASERVLHVLLAVSCLRVTEAGAGTDAPPVQADHQREEGTQEDA